MEYKVAHIIESIEKLAPLNLMMDWDNSGFLAGDEKNKVTKILLAMDIDEQVVDEAITRGVEMIITHHPFIFKPLKNINSKTKIGRLLLKLIKNDIALYTAHTNLDITQGGVNDTLFDKLGLINKEGLLPVAQEGYFLGRVGDLPKEIKLKDYCKIVAQALNVDVMRYVGDGDQLIKKVALCGGAASDYEMYNAAKKKKADVYITGDIKYHETQIAQELELCLIDATHYATEVIALTDLKKYLTKEVPGVEIYASEINQQPFKKI